MAQTQASLILFITFLSILSIPSLSSPPSPFVIEGKVYCDNCRAGFETTITDYMKEAKVKLVCRNSTTQEILHTAEAHTDATGTYKINVKDTHEDEICEVALMSSPEKECGEIKPGRDKARVVLSDTGGMSSNVRHANSLGFLRAKPLEMCGGLLAQYALGDEV